MSFEHSNKVPILIIIVCFIAGVNAIQLLYMVFSPVSRNLGWQYPIYFSGAFALSLISVAGLWFMKKWAALLYMGLLLFNQLVLHSMGLWELSAAVVPAAIIVVLSGRLDTMAWK